MKLLLALRRSLRVGPGTGFCIQEVEHVGEVEGSIQGLVHGSHASGRRKGWPRPSSLRRHRRACRGRLVGRLWQQLEHRFHRTWLPGRRVPAAAGVGFVRRCPHVSARHPVRDEFPRDGHAQGHRQFPVAHIQRTPVGGYASNQGRRQPQGPHPQHASGERRAPQSRGAQLASQLQQHEPAHTRVPRASRRGRCLHPHGAGPAVHLRVQPAGGPPRGHHVVPPSQARLDGHAALQRHVRRHHVADDFDQTNCHRRRPLHGRESRCWRHRRIVVVGFR